MTDLLSGVTVVDITHVHAGPLCTYQLALMGARVIKIESPDGGDMMRGMGPAREPGMTSGFLGQNAGKQSVAIDLKTEAGLGIAKRLVERADVVVSNLRPGTTRRLGIGFEEARQLNPGIIYCEISGYGQTGPESDRAAMDHLMQGESGMFDATGTPEAPARVGFAVVDSGTAVVASSAVAAALYRREKTGEGAYLDVSMLESAMTLMGLNYYNFLANGSTGGRVGRNPLARYGSVGTFDTSDGVLLVNGNNYRLFQRLAEAVERPDLLTDSRFSTPEAATENWAALRGIFETIFRARPAEVWDNLLKDAGVPSGQLKTPAQVMANPQLAHRETVTQLHGVPGTAEGDLEVLGAGFTVDGQPTAPVGNPPRLGEHTRSVLTEWGYSDTELDAFCDSGAISLL